VKLINRNSAPGACEALLGRCQLAFRGTLKGPEEWPFPTTDRFQKERVEPRETRNLRSSTVRLGIAKVVSAVALRRPGTAHIHPGTERTLNVLMEPHAEPLHEGY
jgi:hypothetical protein